MSAFRRQRVSGHSVVSKMMATAGLRTTDSNTREARRMLKCSNKLLPREYSRNCHRKGERERKRERGGGGGEGERERRRRGQRRGERKRERESDGLRALHLGSLVDLGPPLQQQPHHRLVAVLGRYDETRPAVLPQCVRASCVRHVRHGCARGSQR